MVTTNDVVRARLGVLFCGRTVRFDSVVARHVSLYGMHGLPTGCWSMASSAVVVVGDDGRLTPDTCVAFSCQQKPKGIGFRAESMVEACGAYPTSREDRSTRKGSSGRGDIVTWLTPLARGAGGRV